MDSYDYTYLRQLKKFIAKVEKDMKGTPTNADNIKVSFEMICASFFPNVLKNIEELMSKEYIRGYQDGHRDGLEEGGQNAEAEEN